MPTVIVDSSVLITLAAGEQFRLLRDFFGSVYIPPSVWREVSAIPKSYGLADTQQAISEGWLLIRKADSLTKVQNLSFHLQAGETEALALALELAGALLLVDDAQGRRAAAALNIAYTGTLGILLRAKKEGKITTLHSVLSMLKQRTSFWLSPAVYQAALKQAGE